MHVRAALLASATLATQQQIKSEEEEYNAILEETRKREEERDPSYKIIPKFFQPKRVNEISAHLDFAARRRIIMIKKIVKIKL